MKKEIKIGILALVAILVIILGLKFLKGKDIFNSNQTFLIDYADVNGLTISTPVYVHGFQVGIVSDIYLKPTNPEIVTVEIEVEKTIKVPKSTLVLISDVGFMGGKAVKLEYDAHHLGDLAESGDYLRGEVKGLLSSMLGNPDDLSQYMNSIENGVTGVLDTVTDYFKTMDKSKGLGLAMADLQLTIANLKLATNQLNLLLKGSNASLQSTFANLNGITGNINSKNKEISSLVDNFNSISLQVRDAQLDQTIKSANSTFAEATQRMKELEKTLSHADVALDNFSNIVKGVNNGRGTLGKLINDNDLYVNLERTSKQLDLLLQDLRLNPKRYVNVSVFGKKQKTYDLPENDPAIKIIEIQQDTLIK